MITLRFERHKDGSYDVYSCERYNMTIERCPPEGEEEKEVPAKAPLRRVVRMFRTLHDDNPYYESVGDREPHGVAYAMNDSGKTIDTIR